MGRRKLPEIPSYQQPLQPPPSSTSKIPASSTLGAYRALSAEELSYTGSDTAAAQGGVTATDLRQRASVQPMQVSDFRAAAGEGPRGLAGHYFIPPMYSVQTSTAALSQLQRPVVGSESDLRRSMLLEQQQLDARTQQIDARLGSYIARPLGGKPIGATPSGKVSGRSLLEGAKMPATLARVLLKQELKEALMKRRQAIDACEIEANQREYAVHRMLISGLLPDNRKEWDTGPSIVKCSLPPELVAGVRIERRQVPVSSSISSYKTSGKRLPSLRTSATASASVQTQSSHPNIQGISSSTLSKRRKQLPGEPLAYYQSGVAIGKPGIPRAEVSPTSSAMLYRPKPMKDEETQTQTLTSMGRSVSPSRYSNVPRVTDQDFWLRTERASNNLNEMGVVYPLRKLSSGTKPRMKNAATGTQENAGDDHFAPKKSRKGSRLSSNRKIFSDDDDPVAREARKSRLREEIARRREKLSSLGDLTDLKHYHQDDVNSGAALMASDYSSHVPHYGSLPRVDFPSAQKFSAQRLLAQSTQSNASTTAGLPLNRYFPPSAELGREGSTFQAARDSSGQFDRQFFSLPRKLDQYWHFGGENSALADFSGPSLLHPPSQRGQFPPVPIPTSFAGAAPPLLLDQYSNNTLAGCIQPPYNKLQPMYHSAGGNLEASAFSNDFLDPRNRQNPAEFTATMDRYGYQDRTRHRSMPYNLNDLSSRSAAGYSSSYGAPGYGQNYTDAARYSRSADPYYGAPGYYSDSMGASTSVSYPRRPASHDGRTGADGSLLSHYANYLNSDFQNRPSAINDYSYATTAPASPYAYQQQAAQYFPREQQAFGSLSANYSANPAASNPLQNRDMMRRSWADERSAYAYSQPTLSGRRTVASGYDWPQMAAGNTAGMARSMTDSAYYSRPASYSTPDRRYAAGYGAGGAYSDPYGAQSAGLTSERRRAYSGSMVDPYAATYATTAHGRYAQPYSTQPGYSGARAAQYGANWDYQGQQGYGTAHRLYDSGYSSAGYASDGIYGVGTQGYYGQQRYGGPTDINDLFSGPMSKSKSGDLNRNIQGLPFSSAGQLNVGTAFDDSTSFGPLGRSGGSWPKRLQGGQSLRSLGRENKTKSISCTDPRYLYGGPVKRILLTRDPKDRSVKGNGLGMKVVGGKVVPNSGGQLGCFVAAVYKGGLVETLGEVKEGDQILEWNGTPLSGKTYEEVQRIVTQSSGEIEVVMKNDDVNQNKASQMTQSLSADKGYESAPDNLTASANFLTDYGYQHPPTTVSQGNVLGSGGMFRPPNAQQNQMYNVPPPVPAHQYLEGKASPSFSTTPNRANSPMTGQAWTPAMVNCGWLSVSVNAEARTGTLFVTVLAAKELMTRNGAERSGYPSPFVKIYLLPGRRVENKRRTKYIPNTCNPEWNQTVVYKDIRFELLNYNFLEFTVWDYDKLKTNNFLGQAVLSLSDPRILAGEPMWYPLITQSGEPRSESHQVPENHFIPLRGDMVPI